MWEIIWIISAVMWLISLILLIIDKFRDLRLLIAMNMFVVMLNVANIMIKLR